MTLGLAHPFAHPFRSATMVAAIAFGAAAATFAVGLGTSLNQVQATQRHADVVIVPGLPAGGPPPPGSGPRTATKEEVAAATPDPAAVAKAITAQAGTSGYSGLAQTEVTAAGIADPLDTIGFTGGGSSYGYELVSGRWFTQPGEIVVAKPFLTGTHTKVGDTIVLTDHGRQITVKIVGEAFNPENRGLQVLTDLATLATAEPDLRPMTYNITLKPGTDTGAYIKALNTALASTASDTNQAATAEPAETETEPFIIIINTLTALLTLLLITVAALGVLNLVVLETRERVHDLGVHKALGMTPKQTTAMVIASVVVTGLVGGAIGAPVGVLLQRMIVGDMGHTAGFDLPASVIDIYSTTELILFAAGGLLIAIAGSLLPAGWAARTRTATALRTE